MNISDLGFAYLTSNKRFFYLRLSLELSISEFLSKDLSRTSSPLLERLRARYRVGREL